ncbi:hypothetical protein HDU80_011179 [Chytriomyces hyalinus]|nr:hypothetical protein HDU80_011179 [Chytriomyces hyalinus]
MSDPLSDNAASANSSSAGPPQEDSYGFTCTSSYTFKTNTENCMAVAKVFGLDAPTLKTLNPDLPCDSSAAALNGKQVCLGGMNATTGGLMIGNALMKASATSPGGESELGLQGLGRVAGFVSQGTVNSEYQERCSFWSQSYDVSVCWNQIRPVDNSTTS